MAAPFVSGIAALMLRESPHLSGYDIKQLLLQAVSSSSSLQGKVATGGAIDAYQSVTLAQVGYGTGQQPEYELRVRSGNRELASEIASNGGASCGLVKYISDQGSKPNVPPLLVGLLLLIPILVLRSLRKTQKSQRRYERYRIESAGTVNVEGRELIGSISSISLGGVQLNTEAMLEQGGVVSMIIRSPDGKDEIKVEGQIVWSEAQKHYGVQFARPEITVMEKISGWTKSLVRI